MAWERQVQGTGIGLLRELQAVIALLSGASTLVTSGEYGRASAVLHVALEKVSATKDTAALLEFLSDGRRGI